MPVRAACQPGLADGRGAGRARMFFYLVTGRRVVGRPLAGIRAGVPLALDQISQIGHGVSSFLAAARLVRAVVWMRFVGWADHGRLAAGDAGPDVAPAGAGHQADEHAGADRVMALILVVNSPHAGRLT